MNPDSRTAGDRNRIDPQDWRDYGYIWTGPLNNEIGLTNDIHPLFSFHSPIPTQNDPVGPTRAKWKHWYVEEGPDGEPQMRVEELPTRGYQLLEPVLRLASVILLSPASARFLYYLMFGTRRATATPIVVNNIPVLNFYRNATPEAAVHDLVQVALTKLGDSITFIFRDTTEDEGNDAVTQGKTSPAPILYPNGITIRNDKSTTGNASIVAIDEYYYSHLREMYRDRDSHAMDNPLQILAFQFKFALTLCHEIAHAANLAVDLRLLTHFVSHDLSLVNIPYKEPFFEDQRVAEVGWSWENEVFGGYIIQNFDDDNAPLFVCEWPSHTNRSANDPERARPLRLASHHLISMFYVRNIQLQEFWDWVALQPRSDFTLRIRKHVGLKLTYGGTDWHRPSNATSFNAKWGCTGATVLLTTDTGTPDGISERANETRNQKIERLTKEYELMS